MIGRLAGILLEKTPPTLLLDVSGVGYEVDVSMTTFFALPAVGSAVTLAIHHYVREDAHLLYGFGSEEERQAFRVLLRISGVGARTALALLSGMSVQDLCEAVIAQDSGRLIRIPGIGRKTAERLLLELKDKLPKAGDGLRPAPRSGHGDALGALLALGYSEKEAHAALAKVSADLAAPEAIRQALKVLSKVL